MRHYYEVSTFILHYYHTIDTRPLTLPGRSSNRRCTENEKVLVFLTFEGYTCSMGVGIAFNKVPRSFKIAAANLNK